MNAREKINKLHLNTALAAASFLGLAFGSWIVFLATLGVGIYTAMNKKDIRLDSTHRQNHKRNRYRH